MTFTQKYHRILPAILYDEVVKIHVCVLIIFATKILEWDYILYSCVFIKNVNLLNMSI